ncbi:hypothetical protein EDB86DRAFT_3241009 [Lactarius hatsudake]|nr:hypothetical protein EDB86DRAFT_3241009 [Lactarius hatsudake]
MGKVITYGRIMARHRVIKCSAHVATSASLKASTSSTLGTSRITPIKKRAEGHTSVAMSDEYGRLRCLCPTLMDGQGPQTGDIADLSTHQDPPTFAPRITGKLRETPSPGPCFLALSSKVFNRLTAASASYHKVTTVAKYIKKEVLTFSHYVSYYAMLYSLYGDGDNNTHAPHPLCGNAEACQTLHAGHADLEGQSGIQVVYTREVPVVGRKKFSPKQAFATKKGSRISITTPSNLEEEVTCGLFQELSVLVCPHAGLLHKGGDPVAISATLVEKLPEKRMDRSVQDPPVFASVTMRAAIIHSLTLKDSEGQTRSLFAAQETNPQQRSGANPSDACPKKKTQKKIPRPSKSATAWTWALSGRAGPKRSDAGHTRRQILYSSAGEFRVWHYWLSAASSHSNLLIGLQCENYRAITKSMEDAGMQPSTANRKTEWTVLRSKKRQPTPFREVPVLDPNRVQSTPPRDKKTSANIVFGQRDPATCFPSSLLRRFEDAHPSWPSRKRRMQPALRGSVSFDVLQDRTKKCARTTDITKVEKPLYTHNIYELYNNIRDVPPLGYDAHPIICAITPHGDPPASLHGAAELAHHTAGGSGQLRDIKDIVDTVFDVNPVFDLAARRLYSAVNFMKYNPEQLGTQGVRQTHDLGGCR